jgi:hypothetical protein
MRLYTCAGLLLAAYGSAPAGPAGLDLEQAHALEKWDSL